MVGACIFAGADVGVNAGLKIGVSVKTNEELSHSKYALFLKLVHLLMRENYKQWVRIQTEQCGRGGRVKLSKVGKDKERNQTVVIPCKVG